MTEHDWKHTVQMQNGSLSLPGLLLIAWQSVTDFALPWYFDLFHWDAPDTLPWLPSPVKKIPMKSQGHTEVTAENCLWGDFAHIMVQKNLSGFCITWSVIVGEASSLMNGTVATTTSHHTLLTIVTSCCSVTLPKSAVGPEKNPKNSENM